MAEDNGNSRIKYTVNRRRERQVDGETRVIPNQDVSIPTDKQNMQQQPTMDAMNAQGFQSDSKRIDKGMDRLNQLNKNMSDLVNNSLINNQNNDKTLDKQLQEPNKRNESASDVDKNYGTPGSDGRRTNIPNRFPVSNGENKNRSAQNGTKEFLHENSLNPFVPNNETVPERNSKDDLESFSKGSHSLDENTDNTNVSSLNNNDLNQGELVPVNGILNDDGFKDNKDLKETKDKDETPISQKDEKDKKKNEDGEKNPEAPDSSKTFEEEKNKKGNGYGALKRPPIGGKNSDKTGNPVLSNRIARQNRQDASKKQEDNENSEKENQAHSSLLDNSLRNSITGGSLGARIRNGLANLGRSKSKDSISNGGKGGKNIYDSFRHNIGKLKAFLAANPFLVIVIGVVLFIFIILFVSEFNGSSSKGRGAHCTYNLNGVSTTGEVKLEGLQVELINCDAKASNYRVLETVDFEKYVLGVALAEVGSGSPDEAIKAQIIAARGFALTRNRGMCPSNPDGCFVGYNTQTNKIRMRACEADQVYWDYEKDIYRQARGAISLYSPEISGGSVWQSALSSERIAQVQALANDVKGKVLVDSSNNVVSTNYASGISKQFQQKAGEGKSYEQILAEVYGDSDGFSSGQCTSYGNIDFGDYVLSSEGHEILHQPLDSFLQSKGSSLEEFNSKITSSVEKAGYGTRAGVVAAGVTLVGDLGNNYGVKVPYFWGGGHGTIANGAVGNWGSSVCHTYANGQSYNYCGLDCSGFVAWTIYNGGFNITPRTAHDFVNLPGARRVTLTNSAVLEPGDLLESSGHVVLIIGIEESSGQYLCVEASGNSEGVLFTKRPFYSSSYWGVKMDGFYESNVRS